MMKQKQFDIEYTYMNERFKGLITADDLLDAIYRFYSSHGCVCKLVYIKGDYWEINCDNIRIDEGGRRKWLIL